MIGEVALQRRALLGNRLQGRTLPKDPRIVAMACALVLSAAYLVLRPVSSDLAAQVARADLVHRAGNIGWWTGWMGGLSLPSYSLFVPAGMAWLGVRVVGVIATLVGTWVGVSLLSDRARPRWGGVALAASGMADLWAGRVTFVVGFACGTVALAALRGRRPIAAALLSILTFFASPLAGLFLGIVALAVFIADPSRRRAAAASAAGLVTVGVAMQVLFPDTGTMPYRATDMIPPAICCVVVAALCRTPVVRVGALLLLAALPLFFFVPGAVGSNIARMAWVGSLPVLVADAAFTQVTLLAGIVAVFAWPVSDLVSQVSVVRSPATTAAYYAPVTSALQRLQLQTPNSLGERVEIVDTVDHWASTYLSSSFALARGWDRQADLSRNPLFYRNAPLAAADYHAWLAQSAVGWVAVPNATLDYASKREADLIAARPAYLRRVWTSSTWTVYAVTDATPLVEGARVVAVGPSSITVDVTEPGDVLVRVRWNPYLRAVAGVPGGARIECARADAPGILVTAKAPGTIRLVSDFNPVDALATPPRCG